jgi:hypothetical protein
VRSGIGATTLPGNTAAPRLRARIEQNKERHRIINAITLLVKRNKPLLIRVGIVGALLCVLPVVGLLMAKVSPAFILVALVAPFAVWAVVEHLELGLAAMLLAGIFVRFRIPTGTASEIVISLLICVGCIVLWIIHMLVVEQRLTLKPASTNVPLLAFMATVVISWGWSRAFRDLLVHEAGHPLVSVVATLVMVILPSCFLLVANTIRSVRWLQALVWILLGAGLIALVVDLGSHFGVGPMDALNNFLHTNGVIHINTHGLLSMWCVSFALALALFDQRLSWWLRALLLVYIGAWVYWGFLIRIRWLSGWVPVFVAAAVIVFMRSKWLFAVLVVVLLVGAGGYYWRTEFQGESERSGETRLAAYKVNWRITGKHLLFGTGPAGYASYYMSYFPTEAMASHSNYIDIVAQTGIIGTFFLLWFFGAQAWSSYKFSLKLHGQGDFAESLSVAILAGTTSCVIAMALGDWLLPFVYTQGIPGFDLAVFNWLFMGSLWALQYTMASEAIKEDGFQMTEEATP